MSAWQPALAADSPPRSIAVELYVKGDLNAGIKDSLTAAVEQRPGVSLRVFDLLADEEGRTRHEKICAHFKKLPEEFVPALYACSQLVIAPDDKQKLENSLDELRTMTVFVRSGCPRCARTKDWLKTLMPKYPGFRLVYRDVATDGSAQTEMNAVARRYNKGGVSVPMFHVCDQVQIGFDSPEGSGKRLEAVLDKWTVVKKKPAAQSSSGVYSTGALHIAHQCDTAARTRRELWVSRSGRPLAAAVTLPAWILSQIGQAPEVVPATDETQAAATEPATTLDDTLVAAAHDSGDDFELPLPADAGDGELPLPADADAGTSAGDAPADDEIRVPVLGSVRASRMGLPAFTIVIGLIDGFNPCAMWVLLFLLSILVNLQNRWKILAVAGSFVFVSGAAYFAFMAAWLNVIGLIGYERPVQIVLGLFALIIGAVHVKDFFAFKKGISFSIPESAKPGIAARVRGIVMAENLFGAILGATTLAVLINLIELMCTAGLPALYTGVLQQQGIEGWGKYSYLGLYNVAYMFDDALMVMLVVITLDKTRLQEKQGRWLKLVSGAFVLLLGVVMIFDPDLLKFV
ncbi:MAG: glutaredoxin domain-containing protein [Planctomycetaceae bacterium]